VAPFPKKGPCFFQIAFAAHISAEIFLDSGKTCPYCPFELGGFKPIYGKKQ
jgi:hypothetical protein